MFLDEQLIEICENAEISTDEDVQQTYNLLINTCQDYYKERITVGMKKSEGKIIIDRTFRLWDSFVELARKHSNSQVLILGILCEKHTFKKAFMEDEELSEFYSTL